MRFRFPWVSGFACSVTAVALTTLGLWSAVLFGCPAPPDDDDDDDGYYEVYCSTSGGCSDNGDEYFCELDYGLCKGEQGQCIVNSHCVEEADCEDGLCHLLASDVFAPGLDPIELHDPDDGETFSPAEVFRWDSTGLGEVMVAIFAGEPPTYRSGAITNSDQVVWLWHTGLWGSEGYVAYTSGHAVQVDDGVIVSEGPPADNLDPGIYYWAVWAWLDGDIQYASEARALVAGDVALGQGNDCDGGLACFDPLYLADCVEGLCQYRCASRADCPPDQICDLMVADGAFGMPDGHRLGGICVDP